MPLGSPPPFVNQKEEEKKDFRQSTIGWISMTSRVLSLINDISYRPKDSTHELIDKVHLNY